MAMLPLSHPRFKRHNVIEGVMTQFCKQTDVQAKIIYLKLSLLLLFKCPLNVCMTSSVSDTTLFLLR